MYRNASILRLNCPRFFHRRAGWVTHLRSNFGFNVVVKFQPHVWCWISASMLRIQNWDPKISPSKIFSHNVFSNIQIFDIFNYGNVHDEREFCWISHLWLDNVGICRMNDMQASGHQARHLRCQRSLARSLPTIHPLIVREACIHLTRSIISFLSVRSITHWHTVGNYHM